MQANGLGYVGEGDGADAPLRAQPGCGVEDGLFALELRFGGAGSLDLGRRRHGSSVAKLCCVINATMVY